MKEYSLLESGDVSFLNKFFNSEETQEILTIIDNDRKKKIRYYLIILLIWFVTAWPILYFFGWFREILVIALFSILMLMCYMLVWLIISFFVFKKTKTIKWDLLPMFVKQINNNINYSEDANLFVDSFSKLKNIWLLHNYDRVDLEEDSIKYIIWDEDNWVWSFSDKTVLEWEENIVITWCEIKTSKKKTRRTKNGTQTYYVTNNHCYIMKIDFKNPKFVLKNSIKLLEDINDNFYKKAIAVLWIQITCFVPLWFLASDEQWGWLAWRIIELAIDNYFISIVWLIWMYTIIWFIYSYIKWKKRVKLENIEFEKEFDVYSEDQIESRKLLTPSFMYRLVDYVNKINKDRVYEMYFHKNIFYVKFNFLRTGWTKNYMEISKWKNVFNNLEDYVEFYLELKNITALTKDLKLFYYDKWLMTSKVIK